MIEPVEKRRRRGRPKSAPDAKQKEAIAEVALDLFREHGYRNTAMKDVAASAHVSLGTIYRLFPAKAELFGAIVAHHRRFMIALPGNYDGLPVEDALMKIFRVEIDPAEGRLRDDIMAMIIVESREFPELQPILHQYGPEYSQTLLREWLDTEKRNGRIQAECTGVLAKMLMDIVFGASILKTESEPGLPGGNDRGAYLRACFSTIARGIAPNAL